MTMRGPEGGIPANAGAYLVVPGERLAFTDAYVRAWAPAAKTFFTGIGSFADGAGATR